MTVPTTDVDATALLIVHPDKVGQQLGFTLPLSGTVLATVTQAILAAQSSVEGYLGRSITPVQVTVANRWPWPDGWRLPDEDARDLQLVTETDGDGDPTGLFAITYTTGLDAIADPQLRPIRTFVAAAAKNDPAVLRLWRSEIQPAREVTNLAADGQSVSWKAADNGGGGAAGSGAPGALQDLSSLARWKRRSVYQRRGPSPDVVLGFTPWWW